MVRAVMVGLGKMGLSHLAHKQWRKTDLSCLSRQLIVSHSTRLATSASENHFHADDEGLTKNQATEALENYEECPAIFHCKPSVPFQMGGGFAQVCSSVLDDKLESRRSNLILNFTR